MCQVPETTAESQKRQKSERRDKNSSKKRGGQIDPRCRNVSAVCQEVTPENEVASVECDTLRTNDGRWKQSQTKNP